MAEPKFTKGPWAEHGRGGCPCGMIFGPDGNAYIALVYGPGHMTGADGPDCVPNEAAQRANARLISAAPDLYEALVDAKVTLEEAAKVLAEHYPGFGDIVNQCARRCGAALAKADTGAGQ